MTLCSSVRILGGGLMSLVGLNISRASNRRRTLDRHRGRVVYYIMHKVAGGRATRGLFLSVRAIVARHQGVTHGLRVRSPTKLAVCTVMGGLIRLDRIGVGLWCLRVIDKVE